MSEICTQSSTFDGLFIKLMPRVLCIPRIRGKFREIQVNFRFFQAGLFSNDTRPTTASD